MAPLAEPRLPYPVWERIRAPFAAYGERSGAVWAEPPLLQPLARLLDFYGEGLRARLLTVASEEGEDLCLRPDFTLPVAFAHLHSGAAEGSYPYEGTAFRAAPAGSGRPVEFKQIGVERFGASAETAREDAEIIALAWRAAAAGGRGDLSLTLGHVGLFAALLQALDLPNGLAGRLVRALPSPRLLAAELEGARVAAPPRPGGKLSAVLAHLPEAEAADALEELWRLADVRPVGGRSAADIVHRLAERASDDGRPRLTAAQAGLIGRYLAISGPIALALGEVARLAREDGLDLIAPLEAWSARLDALVAATVPLDRATLATAFARPFAYYDGVLFEVRSAALGPDQPLAGGGRYDGLLARLGAETASGAVGCVVRPGRAWDGAGA